MIKKYSFRNFQSYLDECHINFTINKKVPHSYYDYITEDNSKVAKVISILGANGAGKSNLLKPLAFLSWFIPFSYKGLKEKDAIPFIQHILSEDNSSEINVNFIIPGFPDSGESIDLELIYHLKLTPEAVINEELKVKTSRLYSRVFSRTINSDNQTYNIKVGKNFKSKTPKSFLSKVPKTSSLISYLNRLNDSYSEKDNESIHPQDMYHLVFIVYFYFSRNQSNLKFHGKSNFTEGLMEATEFFAKNDEYFDFSKNLLMKYDLGIKDIKIEERIVLNEETGTEEVRLVPMCFHSSGNRSFSLPMFIESSGTQSTYSVLAIISQSFLLGGLTILDEFDNDLHPILTSEIVSLYKDEEINKRRAQLLFTTHNAEILKSLRRQHCYLVEKINSTSEAYRADEIEGLNDRDNLYAKYISGALGGTPEFT